MDEVIVSELRVARLDIAPDLDGSVDGEELIRIYFHLALKSM